MSIKTIETENAPKPIGPYSQGLVVENLLFTSGQIGIDPKTGSLVSGGIEAETKRVFENIDAVLVAGGVARSRVIRVTVYLTDLADFQAVNAVYAQYFGSHKPVRTTVGVAALPKGARIEIDLIAVT